jgi:hypothetical protein
MDDMARLRDAKRRVERLKGFYVHAAIFALVILGLAAINYLLGSPYWVLWVFLGWGLGLAGHAIGVFGQRSTLMSGWETRKIKQYLDERPKT